MSKQTTVVADLQARIKELEAQVNELDIALVMACESYDEEMGPTRCPAFVCDGCVNGDDGCNHWNTTSHSDCWKKQFVAEAKKWIKESEK